MKTTAYSLDNDIDYIEDNYDKKILQVKVIWDMVS